MARVLMLSLLYPPDNVSTAHLMSEVCQDLVTMGHHITVLTTTPHYNPDPIAAREQPLRPLWGRLVQTSTHGGIRVLHTWMPSKGPSPVARVAAWALFHGLSLVVGATVVGPVDVLIAPSPPLTIGVAAWLLGRLKGAPFIYSVLELHPDIAISLGLVRRPTLIRFLYALERFVYAKAARLTVISETMRARVLAKGVAAGKVSLVPNFVNTAETLSTPAPNNFSREHGLDGAFVVCYAGNVGLAQGLESLLDAAALLRDLPAVRIVIVGGGVLWQPFAERIAVERLSNVVLLPHQPFERVPEIYGAADVCVVAQSATTTSDAVPSKVYRIMGAEKPVLAMTEPESDLATLVRASGCGRVTSARDPHRVATTIRDLHRDLEGRRAMGTAGRAHVEAHYSRRHVTSRYNALVNELTRGRA